VAVSYVVGKVIGPGNVPKLERKAWTCGVDDVSDVGNLDIWLNIAGISQ